MAFGLGLMGAGPQLGELIQSQDLMPLFSMHLTCTITPLEKRSIWLDLELNKPYETTINPSHRKQIHKLEHPQVIYENPGLLFSVVGKFSLGGKLQWRPECEKKSAYEQGNRKRGSSWMILITASICFNSQMQPSPPLGQYLLQGLVGCAHGRGHIFSLDMLHGHCQF